MPITRVCTSARRGDIVSVDPIISVDDPIIFDYTLYCTDDPIGALGYVLYRVDLMSPPRVVNGCVNPPHPVERYVIHGWMTPSSGECSPSSTKYLVLRQSKQGAHWQTVAFETGTLISPDYGPFLPFPWWTTEDDEPEESFQTCWIDDETGLLLLEVVHLALIMRSNTDLDPLFKPQPIPGMTWRDNQWQCPEGQVPISTLPCCEDEGGSGLPPIPKDVLDVGKALAALYQDDYNNGMVPILGTTGDWPYCRQVDPADTNFGAPGAVINTSDWSGHGVGINGDYDAEISTIITWFASPNSMIYRDVKESCECPDSSMCTYLVSMTLHFTALGIYESAPLMQLTVTYPCDCEFTPTTWTGGKLRAKIPYTTGTFNVTVTTTLINIE